MDEDWWKAQKSLIVASLWRLYGQSRHWFKEMIVKGGHPLKI